MVNLVVHPVPRLCRGVLGYANPYAKAMTVARTHRSVRVDEELLLELEELARQQLIPVGFTDQVEAGLRLLVRDATEQQTRQAAGLVGADRQRAEQTYRRLHARGGER